MTEQAISPLRRRMIEDMAIRKFAQKTQHDYAQRVKDFANYLKRSPDTANPSSSCESVIHSNPLATSHSGTQRSVCLKGLPRHTCSVAHWPTNLHAETEL
jgi:hypothetical protein